MGNTSPPLAGIIRKAVFDAVLKGRSCLGALHGCLQSPGLQQVADLVQCFYQHHHDHRPHPHEHHKTAARHNKEPAPPARLPPPHPALRSSLQHHQVLREQGAKLLLEFVLFFHHCLCPCLCHCLCHVLILVSVFSRPHRTRREVRLQCQSNHLRIRKFSSRGEDSCLHKYFSIFGEIVKTFTKKFSFRELFVNRTNSLVEICLSHVEIKVQIFYFWKLSTTRKTNTSKQ